MQTDKPSRKHFQEEALILSQFNRQCRYLHDFDTQHGMDFLVVGYIPGITLSENVAAGLLRESEVSAWKATR